MCEPLKEKVAEYHEVGFECIDKDDYYFRYGDVKSAVRFFQKYRWEIEMFAEDFPDEYNEARENGMQDMEDIEEFNQWLIGYSFKDAV